MRDFLQGRIDLVKALRASQLPVSQQDLGLILMSVISACAAYRWPGEGFDRKRFVESLIRFSPPRLRLDSISIGALLEKHLISEGDTPWGALGQMTDIFKGDEIDCSFHAASLRFPHLASKDLKDASYASLIYRWLRCGYAHNYWAAGNSTHVPAAQSSAQISYIGRLQANGNLVRIAAFHLDYLIEVTQQQVASLSDQALQKPRVWWLEQD